MGIEELTILKGIRVPINLDKTLQAKATACGMSYDEYVVALIQGALLEEACEEKRDR